MFQLKNKKRKEQTEALIEGIKSVNEIVREESDGDLKDQNKNILDQLIEQKKKIKQQIDILISKIDSRE